ncbi:MAG: hypothetical protein ACI8RA_002679 [Chlamydiales bacterium]|jgi:hypothetical protein
MKDVRFREIVQAVDVSNGYCSGKSSLSESIKKEIVGNIARHGFCLEATDRF